MRLPAQSVVCTRQYRPPEVTLGLEWTHCVDLWSMGCILVELWTGAVLFSTHDEVQHTRNTPATPATTPQ
jgi:dual-specificity kinase